MVKYNILIMDTEIINTKKVLSETNISIGDYAINPYRGCEFNCVYCYSKKNKNLNNFSRIGIKINAPEILERELHYKNPKRVILGSITECFQYQELKYKLTEKIIKILNRFNIAYTILTKSHLIEKYLDLIAKNKKNEIYFTFNFFSNKIIRTLEKNSPLVSKRIEIIKKILKKNIRLRIHIGPFIPYLSLLEDIIKNLPEDIKEINVELYHGKMGNLEDLIKKIQEIDKDLSKKILDVYSDKKNYLNFSKNLEEEIKKYKEKNYKFCYIVPEFDNFYNYIDYNKFL